MVDLEEICHGLIERLMKDMTAELRQHKSNVKCYEWKGVEDSIRTRKSPPELPPKLGVDEFELKHWPEFVKSP